jgi:signal transduction histidine kinase
MRTTFSRTFVTYAMILLAALLLVGTSFQLLVRNYLTDQTIDRLKNDSTTIAQVAAAYYNDDAMSNKDFLINLSVASKVSGADAVICDASGTLVMCSDAPLGCEHLGLTITNRKYLDQIARQEYTVSNGIIEGLYQDSRYVVSTAIRDSATNKTMGFVIVSTPMKATTAVLKRLSDTYLSVSVLVVLVAVVVMTIYTRKNSNPLRDMAKTATAFGHGNLKARADVPKDAPEEIQELALAFNNMARSLERSEYQRKEFVANVSHELKTPMTTIGGYVDGVLDGTIPAQQHRHYLQIVSDETKRLSRLVRSMLDISQLQEEGSIPEEKKTRFDVSECAGRVLITFEGKINSRALDVAVDMPEHPVYTYACQDYITQVIYNLLDNAVKFCPQGGTLGLNIREGTSKVYVTVSNDGNTIPAQELPLLFDRFHKLDKSRSENREGWGLGLYIVKTLICSHGEDVSVSSTDGKTEFTFTLPLTN